VNEAPSAVLIADSGLDALRRQIENHPEHGNAVVSFAERIRGRRFQVLGSPVPVDGPWPWHSDWRWGKSWPRGFFRTFDAYEARDVPFDIKMPWELSRLTFVPSLLQAAAVGGGDSYRDAAVGILTEWERENPLAYSVNWHPMEASMRGICIVLMIGMLRSTGEMDLPLLNLLARMASAHGEFLARTIEYSDVRGNHYMANVVAMLVLGLALGHVYSPARRWMRFGIREFPRECGLQFLADGVNFEGSVAYHRFVTELALLGAIAMEHSGFGIPQGTKLRLHLACRYIAACRRPDGLMPNVGDNDSAIVLPWDPGSPRDPAAVLSLGAIVFNDPILRGVGDANPPSAVAWITGHAGSNKWEQLEARRDRPFCKYYPDGGVVIARSARDYLWVDVGEVGFAGRGGHGHNDLGSFELALNGYPLVVDSGSPVYSADPEQRNAFRSTGAHNTVKVDGQEIARLGGLWEIADEARPVGVRYEAAADHVTVSVEHHGFRRLPDPVVVRRTLSFSPYERILQCTDLVMARGLHLVERFLHLGVNVTANVQENRVVLACGEHCWVLTWEPRCAVSLERGWVSPEYGLLESSSVVILRNEVLGDAELVFAIAERGQ
jgi:hypothetical protein